ncbi:MAG TPA: amidase [Candidatus Dormibacteraeota bacterium]|jgi:amidase|nr:amidase [Candidatus Dormibacteraeota bacterium]
MSDEIWAFKPAREQATAIAGREISPRELLSIYYDRIASIDGELNSYVLLTRELAESQATACEKRIAAGQPLGLLDGVPVSIKETSALAGYRNSLGSRAFEDAIARVDGFAIGRLKEEGAVILGKTNAPEFGTRPVTEGPLFPPARNPVDPSRTAGGSSGGAAAALAAGLCALAHGGDGGGSIRIPASCCGVVGLKPSRGRISSGPLLGEDWAGLATTGVLARTVEDAALGLQAMAGHLPGDPYWAELDGPLIGAARRKPERLRIGWTVDAPAKVDGEVVTAVESAVEQLSTLGHEVSRVRPDLGNFRPLIQVLAVTSVGALPIQRPELLDPLNRLMFEVASQTTAVDYLRTLTQLHQRARTLIATWDQIDVLLTPTLTRPAPRLGELGSHVETASDEFLDWLSFTHPFNCTGQPAISLPLAETKAGLPIGIQLVGRPRDEYTILSLGAQLEATIGFRNAR